MLVGTGTDTEPAVIGDIDQPSGPFATRYRCVGEDRLVTNQRQHLWRPGYVDGAPPVTRQKATDDLGELLQAEPFKQSLKRQVFAERNQMDFVIDRADRAIGLDHVD